MISLTMFGYGYFATPAQWVPGFAESPFLSDYLIVGAIPAVATVVLFTFAHRRHARHERSE